jgi:hypothetical protein
VSRNSHETAERRVLELLPWYVNGTLEGAEHDEVRRALRSSLTLGREHDRLVRLLVLMRLDDAEQAATGRAFERLVTRIQRRRPWQRPAAWQAAAAALAVVGLALWWQVELPSGPRRFETLTTAETGAASLRVLFAPDVEAHARDALLAAHGLAIRAPPTPEGVYTLVLPENADARAIADALRADPRVAFASMPPASVAR